MSEDDSRSDSPASGDIVALILAAGRGRRMGGSKALLEIAGSPLLLHVARAYDELTEISIHAVVSEEIDEQLRDNSLFPAELKLHIVEDPEAPMMHSVRAGLRALASTSYRRLFLQPVDAGPPRSTTLHALLDALPDGLAVKPTHAGRGGHPVLLSREILDRMPWEHASSLREALAALGPAAMHRWECANDDVLRNWNRPEDLPR